MERTGLGLGKMCAVKDEASVLAQSRTVRVVRTTTSSGEDVVEKTYSFPQPKDRLRGALRGTWLSRNKAFREFDHLQYLNQHAIPAVLPHSWSVRRDMLGFVRTCVLRTQYQPSPNLETCLKTYSELPADLWHVLGSSVRRMHQLGFWHRGLSARNVLVDGEKLRVWWLDPSKSRRFPSSALPARAQAHDLLRFWTPIHKQVSAQNQQAFAEGYADAIAIDLPKLQTAIPSRKRSSLQCELQREEARFSRRA